ncbi:hypothetical protein C8E03_106206 [Lachnotalea glycerini]|uniref:Phosphotransferase system EIIC domain-containing protein n=1 Tax=Lachnotalea glycerini TaxID=1763509 RepID=A0A318ER97_9FIRM|nr:PTS sugar transporter subunit IIC [Lachnotalea glycerini]PXV89554.1 hypothetical protein C8E03_106206 [Lachnotalea glycerini]
MEKFKNILNRIFIDGLSGMALGLFSTLIIGTIIQQIGNLVGGTLGNTLYLIGKISAALTGAGIGCGVAYKFKSSPLVLLSSATAGMIGAFASKILIGGVMVSGTLGELTLNQAILLIGPGEPLGAFVSAYIGIEFGNLVSGRTQVDILITPFVSIVTGAFAGLFIGTPISMFMTSLGDLINWGTIQQPVLMGIIVSVLMGMILTLPISSAALGISLSLSGLAAGAATIGCCCNMIGFAIASYRENKTSGLIAQGIGTSMLQVPNIVKKPIIWLPAIISSAILGPIGTLIFHMENNSTGSGMGSAGLVGQIMTWNTMLASDGAFLVLFKILCMHFIFPAILSLLISEWMRKKGLLQFGDMLLKL